MTQAMMDLIDICDRAGAAGVAAALHLLADKGVEAVFIALDVDPDYPEDMPDFCVILQNALEGQYEAAADFALRDLLVEYPALRALCVKLPEGMEVTK